MTERKCPVRIVERAHELAERVRVDLADDRYHPEEPYPELVGLLGYKSERMPWRMEVAGVRDEYTNYEMLLQWLPLCVCVDPDWAGCNDECRFLSGRSNLVYAGVRCQCPYLEQALDVLKWAANDVARAALIKFYSEEKQAGRPKGGKVMELLAPVKFLEGSVMERLQNAGLALSMAQEAWGKDHGDSYVMEGMRGASRQIEKIMEALGVPARKAKGG